jgi:hypothetical protein
MHPRAHVVERDVCQHRGRPTRYRAQIKDLRVGDTLAEFGKVLEWSESGTADGWPMYRMVTERPQHFPTETNVFVCPSYMYFGITALAEGEGQTSNPHQHYEDHAPGSASPYCTACQWHVAHAMADDAYTG